MIPTNRLAPLALVTLLAACGETAPSSPRAAIESPAEGGVSAAPQTEDGSAAVCSSETAPREVTNAPRPPAGPARHPVRWLKSVPLRTLADLAIERQKPVADLELTNRDGAKRRVQSCDDYAKAGADGFGVVSNLDILAESAFLVACTPLRFIEQAGASSKSWVSDLRLDRRPLHTLPASMNLILAGLEPDQERAVAAGQRLDLFQPELRVTAASATSVTFDEPKVDTSTVEIVAFGDFDHDGIEDVLLYQTHHSLQGTFRSYHHLVATRRGPNEPLTVIAKLR